MADPNGWVSNPPSTFVKVENVAARPEVNSEIALVLNYQADRGRYIVVLTKRPQESPLSLKAENLKKASYFEQMQGQYNLVQSDPRLQQQLFGILDKVKQTTGVDPKYLLIMTLVAVAASIYFLGFSRTFLFITFLLLLGMILGADLMQGKSLQVAARNAPNRLRMMLRQSQIPFGNKIADNDKYLAAFCFLIVAFFVTGMAPKNLLSRAASSTAPSFAAPTAKDLEHYYRLGFDDATNDKPFGHSLPNVQDMAPTPLPPRNLDASSEFVLDEALFGQPPAKKKSPFGMGSLLSIFFVGRTFFDLGYDGQSFSIARMRQNLYTLETWKLGLLGLSIYRIVSAVIGSL